VVIAVGTRHTASGAPSLRRLRTTRSAICARAALIMFIRQLEYLVTLARESISPRLRGLPRVAAGALLGDPAVWRRSWA